jgi:hypothetical protein
MTTTTYPQGMNNKRQACNMYNWYSKVDLLFVLKIFWLSLLVSWSQVGMRMNKKNERTGLKDVRRLVSVAASIHDLET